MPHVYHANQLTPLKGPRLRHVTGPDWHWLAGCRAAGSDSWPNRGMPRAIARRNESFVTSLC